MKSHVVFNNVSKNACTLFISTALSHTVPYHRGMTSFCAVMTKEMFTFLLKTFIHEY